MAEAIGDDAHRYAEAQELAGLRMPKIVKPTDRQAGSADEFTECLGQVVWIVHASVGARGYPGFRVLPDAEAQQSLCLLNFNAPLFYNDRRGDCYDPGFAVFGCFQPDAARELLNMLLDNLGRKRAVRRQR